MTEKECLISTSIFSYLGPMRIRLLYSFFKSAKGIWNCPCKKLEELGISPKKAREFDDFRKNFNVKKYFIELTRLGIGVTTFLDRDFPPKLQDLIGGPVLLYYKGDISCIRRQSVAIVGTRRMTSYGREVTEIFSGSLAEFGVTIISGLARGIDTIAHKSCLAAGGTTAAVLGSGLDTIYPSENKILAEEIVKKDGVIVSEYPLNYPALPENFVVRNRIVSGLSTCVLVIEGAEKSGTLTTATHAAEQGKTVFAVPGQITSPLSKAPLFLIKNGARVATEPKDILDELDISVKVDKKRMQKIIPDDPKENNIMKILENEPLYLDEVVRITGCKTSEISARLTFMEMKGMIKDLGGGKYKRTGD